MSEISSVVTGIGRYLPEKSITSEEIEDKLGFENYGMRKGMIELFTGVKSRRYAGDDIYPSSLAALSAKEAIKNAGIAPTAIDVIIFCAITTDFLEPSIADLVQDEIGATNAHCFDIKNACNAFMNGLDLADSLIKTGKAKNVLVTSGEKISPLLKFKCKDRNEIEQRHSSYSCGDGGGAFIISAEKNTERGIKNSAFQTHGAYWNNNVNWGGGSRYPHDPEQFYFWGDTKNLVNISFDLVPKLFFNTLKEIDWDTNSISCLVGAQVAVYITNEMTKRLGIPKEKSVSILEKYGNTGAAGIPMATYEAVKNGTIKPGDKIVLFGAGNGLSIGCICINW